MIILMDWENRFSNIVRDTEANLAKIRSRLGPSRQSSILPNSFSIFGSQIEPSLWHSASPFLDFPLINNEFLGLPNLPSENVINDNTSVTRLQVLEEKVTNQSKTIKDLVRTVKQLQNVKNEQQRENTSLREELNILKKRLTEFEVLQESENKHELWKHDLQIGLSSIQNHLYKSHIQGDNLSAVHVDGYIRELYEMRHLLLQECEIIKRDFDRHKNKQMQVESNLDTLSSVIKEVAKQTDFLEKQLKQLSHKIESQKYKNEESETERREIKNQLKEFRSNLQNFREKLASIDLTVQKNEDIESLPSISDKSPERKEKDSDSIAGDDSLDLSSDLNLSDDDDSKLVELFSDGHAADIDSNESLLISSDTDTDLKNL